MKWRVRLTITRGVILSIAVGGLLWSTPAVAGEEFHTVARIPVELLSRSEMAAVEGQLLDSTLLGLIGPGGLLDLFSITGGGVDQLLDLGVLAIVLGSGSPGGSGAPGLSGIPLAAFEGLGGAIGPGQIPLFP